MSKSSTFKTVIIIKSENKLFRFNNDICIDDEGNEFKDDLKIKAICRKTNDIFPQTIYKPTSKITSLMYYDNDKKEWCNAKCYFADNVYMQILTNETIKICYHILPDKTRIKFFNNNYEYIYT